MFSYKTLDNTSIEIIHKAFIDAFSDYQVKMEMPIWKFEQMLLRRGYVPEMSIGAFINAEVTQYLDVILMAIEENNLPEEEQRGLMRYFDDHDSVNAKLSKYVFSVELVEGELMGVAVLTLNDGLNPKELEKIKDNITGQASDGWGEVFEQRELCIDMGDVYISFWSSSKSWFIKTVEEMGINQNQIIGGMKFE